MLIRVINPNTTWSMTERIGAAARTVAASGTRIEAVSPAMGPASIESHYDEALSVPGLLLEVEKGERDGADGYVVACFGDPGLDAARELAAGPVLGTAEAAMHTASLLGRGFTVVTSLARTGGRAWDLAEHYGLRRQCRGVRACDLPVLDIETDPHVVKVLVDQCRDALEQDGSDAIVLGCAGMADLAREISSQIGAPVVDGVASATALVQALVTMGLATGKGGEYARPLPKAYTGALAAFSRPD